MTQSTNLGVNDTQGAPAGSSQSRETVQPLPLPASTYLADIALREHLARLLPKPVLDAAGDEFEQLGRRAAGEMRELARGAELRPPTLTKFDDSGNRIDRIDVSPQWHQLHLIQVGAGLCAIPYENRFGEHARVVQHALLHIYGPSSAVYNCPVSMSDGAVRTLIDHADSDLRDRVVPRLTSRDPEAAWTSGQWMTERSGGSDVGRSESVARLGSDRRWRLHGLKWLASATTADCALALARPEGAEPGSSGLALFLVELVDPYTGEQQTGRTILINGLKNKLGTRALPTAELTLEGAIATPIGNLEGGLRKISSMLSVCRLHNSVAAAAAMRRGQQLAESFAQVRQAFGAPLSELPLHRDTLRQMNARAEGAFAMTAEAMALFGRHERGRSSEHERRVLRALVPLTKLFTAKEAVWHASETLECFGGAGYVEDGELPTILRDAQALPIWEGTTNVLSLDLLRAETKDRAVSALLEQCERLLCIGGESNTPAGDVDYVVEELGREIALWAHRPPQETEAGMRAFALRLGRVYSAAVVIAHARGLSEAGDDRALDVATLLAARAR